MAGWRALYLVKPLEFWSGSNLSDWMVLSLSEESHILVTSVSQPSKVGEMADRMGGMETNGFFFPGQRISQVPLWDRHGCCHPPFTGGIKRLLSVTVCFYCILAGVLFTAAWVQCRGWHPTILPRAPPSLYIPGAPGTTTLEQLQAFTLQQAFTSFFFGTLTVSLRLSSRAICNLRSSPRLRRSSWSGTMELEAEGNVDSNTAGQRPHWPATGKALHHVAFQGRIQFSWKQ